MPKKAKEKSVAERTAEEYFPVSPENIKRTTEKLEKPTPVPSIIRSVEKAVAEPEKDILTYRKKTRVSRANGKPKIPRKKKAAGKKPFGKKPAFKKSFKKFEPAKITLGEKGYELIITEKPQAALKIASALGSAAQRNAGGVSYYEVKRKNSKNNIIVACAVGHLFTLRQNSPGADVPVFDIGWVPNFMALKKDFTKRYYDVLSRLAKDAGSITVATDYDNEGEVIGLNVVRFICGQNDASRMKFSTLTDAELNKAYEEKSPNLNWGQAMAGETRHYLDWFYGINLSRALMNAIKTTGKFKIMSIGRVQGPSLNLLVKKEREIQAFKPQPYWQAFITLEKPKIELKFTKEIYKKEHLKNFENLAGKTAEVSTSKTSQTISPNPPFNLTSLQTEAYAFHGITPSNTLRAAQSLYLAGLISYPRTSSQKLPAAINYLPILQKLAKEFNAEQYVKRAEPVEGKKTDPAHPSIYPTGNRQSLEGDEAKIYNLIARRFISLFCADAIVNNKTIRAEVEIGEKSANEKSTIDNKVNDKKEGSYINKNQSARDSERNLIFSARGSSIQEKGWMAVYPAKITEKSIPDANGKIKIASSRTEEKETQPPKRFSQASIISELEKRNLGTKATRAAIIETLYDRGYVREKSIEATSLGMSLISTLEKYSPIIIDENLTRNFEKEMESLLGSKKSLPEKEEKIKNEAKEVIKKILGQFSKEEKKIGEDLMSAQEEERANEKERSKIMVCPQCRKGSLAITYSRKNRRFFIACNAYPECKTTFSLPPFGMVKKLDPEKLCEKCNFPLLMSLQKGKRPWIFCFNSNCETNKQRLEEYRKRKEMEKNDA